MAKPAYVWNGTAWEAIGPVIPASPFFYQATAPTSPATGNVWTNSTTKATQIWNGTAWEAFGVAQVSRWKYTALGGETSFTGVSGGVTLAYTAGIEQVYLNGVMLARGDDYTATSGTAIDFITAVVVGDIIEVLSIQSFAIADTYTRVQLDALLGDAGVHPLFLIGA